MRSAVGWSAVMTAAIGVSACGGSSSPSSTPSTSHAATPTPSPAAGPSLVVWAAASGGGIELRTLTPAGSGAHTVATVPNTSQFMSCGAGKLVYLSQDLTLHVVSLKTGVDTGYPSGAMPPDDTVFGGAISPDGTRVAYVVATMSHGATLRVLTIASSSSSTIKTFSGGPVDAPVLWTASRIVATGVVPYADAGPQSAVGLDPITGSETFSTNLAGAGGPVYSSDGTHVANEIHTPTLGDEGDMQQGPGPQLPFNTLRTFSLGGTPAIVYQKPHHNITTLAVSTAGTNVLFFNDSSAGGFAGISMSPDFGLFIYPAGLTPIQLEKLDGPRWDSAAFVNDTTAFAARHVGGDEQLAMVSTGHAPTAVDTVAGGDAPAFVCFSPTS